MLIKTSELKKLDDFKDIDEEVLERKLKAIEVAIRQYTSNNFQNRYIRFNASSSNNKLDKSIPYFKVGDTIEISQGINKGLYTVASITETEITLKEDLYDCECNLCTKVEYPADIIEGALSILKWDLEMANKVGISSESISRHSVSYQNLDSSNTIEGRPAQLFGFCKPYMCLRF